MPFPYEEFDLSGVVTYPLSARRSKARAEDFARPVERGDRRIGIGQAVAPRLDRSELRLKTEDGQTVPLELPFLVGGFPLRRRWWPHATLRSSPSRPWFVPREKRKARACAHGAAMQMDASEEPSATAVETEVNGFLTYDREVLKMDESRMRDANLGKGTANPLAFAPPGLTEHIARTEGWTFGIL